MKTLLAPWSSQLLSILRIVTGFLFICPRHAESARISGAVAASGRVLVAFAGVAGALELVGGALMIIGLFTRPVAFILSGLMAFAYFIAHAPQGFWPIVNRGELAALYSFVFLYFAAAGGGPWSLDQALRRRDDAWSGDPALAASTTPSASWLDWPRSTPATA